MKNKLLNKLIYILPILLFFISCRREEDTYVSNEIFVSNALSSVNDSGFIKAYDIRQFNFPDDNGPHYGYRTEWWYFTGNLSTEDNRKFGYQLTVFRTAMNPDTPDANGWSSNQIYMGHFTVTDVKENKFYYFEKFSREGNNLAGAESSPLRIWIENWNVTQLQTTKYDFPKVLLSASQDNIFIELTLEPAKKIVLQGHEGLSKKGSDSGNASYYYSVSRLKTDGTIRIDNNDFRVNGDSWLDREWSTSALSSEQQGWDWFSLQLDNNYEIMYYQMRKKDGSPDEYSGGSLIFPDGSKKNFSLKDVELSVTDEWINSRNRKYPSGWLLKIPGENIDLVIKPLIQAQELLLTVIYWEGAVGILGNFKGQDVKGYGYVELTGYEN